MPYTSLAALTARFGEEMLVQLTDHLTVPTGTIGMATVGDVLASTDAVVDAALAVRYRLPLVAVPAVVAEIALNIAIYKLHRSEPEAKIGKDYDQALRDLDAIAKGTRRLDLAGIEPEGSGSGGVIATDRPRDFTPANMRGFI